MQFPGVLFQTLCVASFVVGLGNGDPVESRSIDNQFMRVERGVSMTQEAIKGMMAWRKLLWNSMPATRYGSPKNLKRYKKAGDFSHAKEDFLSVVPEDTLFKGRDALNGRIYGGTVGDRRVILKQNVGANDVHATIDILNLNNGNKDKIVYMGTDWVKRP